MIGSGNRVIGKSGHRKESFSTDLARAVCRFPQSSYKITSSLQRADACCMNAAFTRTPVNRTPVTETQQKLKT
jgi:hypothetical protein